VASVPPVGQARKDRTAGSMKQPGVSQHDLLNSLFRYTAKLPGSRAVDHS
jgi:hypothetical protein